MGGDGDSLHITAHADAPVRVFVGVVAAETGTASHATHNPSDDSILLPGVCVCVCVAQVTCIDIGGGLPVNFASEKIEPTFQQYADLLKSTAPELFTGEYKVLTEFGRAICAKVRTCRILWHNCSLVRKGQPHSIAHFSRPVQMYASHILWHTCSLMKIKGRPLQNPLATLCSSSFLSATQDMMLLHTRSKTPLMIMFPRPWPG